MATPVVMPQMGESIAEGTIVRWIKKVGDAVERDEPLFEISTDKVDAEIPSPAAGILADIAVHEGETVAVNSVVATIRQAGDAVDAGGPGRAAAADIASGGGASRQQPDGQSPPTPTPADRTAASVAPQRATPVAAPTSAPTAAPAEHEGNGRRRSSPLVRRIAKDHNVDIAQISGSGIGGRVTKHDILGYIEHAPAGGSAQRGTVPTPRPTGGDRVEKLSVMRKKIAEHMILSRRTSAHVHSVFHVNFSTIAAIRQEKKAAYEQAGARLTYMSFIARAIIEALRRHPVLNASLDGDNVVYKSDINLGVAVALEDGLIVPVIRNADEKNLLGLSRAIADVAERARAKRLNPDEVHGGTFTITNPGQFGAQFGMPIINQPQVAILGVGTIEKRPVVVEDAIGIRTMAYLTLGYDHRLVDGAVADQFMADVKHHLEHFDGGDV
jgi:2-oxoglutarate dehydrogenase E2 component (dihydrolipoamide succinyltransferase)